MSQSTGFQRAGRLPGEACQGWDTFLVVTRRGKGAISILSVEAAGRTAPDPERSCPSVRVGRLRVPVWEGGREGGAGLTERVFLGLFRGGGSGWVSWLEISGRAVSRAP